MECGVRRRAPGLRIKTENNGFAGSRAQTAPALQREKRKIPASGLRIKTKNKGIAGNRAQTAPEGCAAKKLLIKKSRRLLLVSGGSGDGLCATFNFGCPGKLWPGRMFFLWGIKR